MSQFPPAYESALQQFVHFASQHARQLDSKPVTASAEALATALLDLPRQLPDAGSGLKQTLKTLYDLVMPALAMGQSGPRYFGFVTGGVAPAAQFADFLATLADTNVQVNLHQETIATWVEAQCLSQLCTLLHLDPHVFSSRTLTTGATSSNILGLSLGREHALKQIKGWQWSVAEDGFGGVDIDIFCAGSHASILKAAALTGIGRANVHEMARTDIDQPCAFDLGQLEARLEDSSEKGRGKIVVAAIGEVNTGGCTPEMAKIRQLCDAHDAWFHIDAAFGAFAVLHPDFEHLATDMAQADSITSDAHKWAQAPYDCGLFFARGTSSLQEVCGPGSKRQPPAYLTPASSKLAETEDAHLQSLQSEFATQASPLHINIENSRRFRALPLYANLLSFGKDGYTELICRNIAFARAVESWLRSQPDWDVLTPESSAEFNMMNVVLFAPSSSSALSIFAEGAASEVVKRINATRKMYVSATSWRGRGAIRMAVCNWMTTLERDLPIVKETLQRILQQ